MTIVVSAVVVVNHLHNVIVTEISYIVKELVVETLNMTNVMFVMAVVDKKVLVTVMVM